jgi:glycosyltransferase involved in cell wall biosynthesis
MPVYNAERFLKQAIDSILNQTYQDFQLLLIDDASTDHCMDIIKSYQDPRIKVFQNQKNMGISCTRNRGIELCNTEYMALMDDDDISMPYRLEHEVKFLDEHPEVDVVGGHQRQIDEDGRDLNKQWNVYLNPKYIKAFLMSSNTIVNGSTMFRKEFIDRYHIRYQEENCFGAEDYRFWVDCSLKGTIANLDEVLLLWRTGHRNESKRAVTEFIKERKEFIDKLHKYALEMNGIHLSREHQQIYNKVFFEDTFIDSSEELDLLFDALQSVARQAREQKLDNAEEIVTMCRKRYGEKVGKAFFLWN